MGFSRQEYQSGLPFPSPGHLPKPGTELISPTLQGAFFTAEPPGKPFQVTVSQVLTQEITFPFRKCRASVFQIYGYRPETQALRWLKRTPPCHPGAPHTVEADFPDSFPSSLVGKTNRSEQKAQRVMQEEVRKGFLEYKVQPAMMHVSLTQMKVT